MTRNTVSIKNIQLHYHHIVVALHSTLLGVFVSCWALYARKASITAAVLVGLLWTSANLSILGVIVHEQQPQRVPPPNRPAFLPPMFGLLAGYLFMGVYYMEWVQSGYNNTIPEIVLLALGYCCASGMMLYGLYTLEVQRRLRLALTQAGGSEWVA